MKLTEEEKRISRSQAKTKMIAVFCRACHSRIRFDERPELYDIVSCPECDEEFEVIGISPIQIDWPSEFSDDDDDWSVSGLDDDRFDD